MDTLTKSFLFIEYLLFFTPTVLELCLTVDLALTLKRPMAKQETRVKYYLLLALTINIIGAVVFDVSDFDYKRKSVNSFFQCVNAFYLITYIICMVIICKRYKNGGLNQ